MDSNIYEAKTIDDAVQQGLDELHLLRDEVSVEVLQEPRKGFLGLGERPARVALTVNENAPEEITPADDESDGEAPEEMPDEAPTMAMDEAFEDTADADKADEDVEDEEDDEEEDSAPTPTKQRDVEWVAQYLIDVMRAYRVDVTVNVEESDDAITYHIDTDKPGLVIGKHGKIVNALEILAQVATHRYVRSHVAVTVDVGDYRERRDAILTQLAERVADEVTMNRDTEYLNPLPARERKIVHQLLAHYQHLETHSEGREPHRYLVVSYKE